MTEVDVFKQMEQAILSIYILHQDNRDDYEKAAVTISKQRMPEAPDAVRQIFVKMALDVFDKMKE